MSNLYSLFDYYYVCNSDSLLICIVECIISEISSILHHWMDNPGIYDEDGRPMLLPLLQKAIQGQVIIAQAFAQEVFGSIKGRVGQVP